MLGYGGVEESHLAGGNPFVNSVWFEGEGGCSAVTAEADIDHVLCAGDGDDVDHMRPISLQFRQPGHWHLRVTMR